MARFRRLKDFPTVSGLGGEGAYMFRILHTQPSYLVGYWLLDEAAGYQAVNRVGGSYTGELVTNGGFEADYSQSVSPGWLNRTGTGAVARTTTPGEYRSGTGAAKLTAGAGTDTWIYLQLNVIPGNTYAWSFWTRGDGTNSGRYSLKDTTNNGWLVAFHTTTGISGTTFSEKTGSFTAPAGCRQVTLYLECPGVNGGVAYFDDVSVTGTIDSSGTYPTAGITFGQAGIGDGKKSTRYDGTNGYVMIASQQFHSVFNPDVGSAIAWGRAADSAVWTDASKLRYLVHCKCDSDLYSYIVFGKHTDNHTLMWRRKTGNLKNDNEQKYVFASGGPAGWFCMGYSWDIVTPRLKGYLYAPGLLAWTKVFDIPGGDMTSLTGVTFSQYNTTLMAGSAVSVAQQWNGWGAHVALWAGVTLTDAEMRRVMVP